MPFPPTFTDVWDITQPPDTQLANLLGQDIRNLKLDIMQRLSLLSGTTANRPTPETVNATWGGTGYGLLYFATDTGIIYQWNGSAWVVVTFASSFRFSDTATYTSSTSPTTSAGFSIQSSQANAGSVMKISTWGITTGTSGVSQVQLQAGSNFLVTAGSIPISTDWRVTADLMFISGTQFRYYVEYEWSGSVVFNTEGAIGSLTYPLSFTTTIQGASTVTITQNAFTGVIWP